jgi:hypothetical protein
MNDYRKSIRRNIQRQIQKNPPKASNEQAIILSGLNIMQVLEDNAPKYLHTVLHYGPDSFIGEGWAVALVWYRRKGYQHYKELTLFGTWLLAKEDETAIIIGTKRLPFSAAVYNAESYNAVIKQTFKPYYGDEISPPSDSSIIYQTTFDLTHRLALRRELADKIILWMRETNF